MRQLISAIYAVLFAVFSLSLARSGDSDVYYVLPDHQFVTAECARLLQTSSNVADLAQANEAVRIACQQYSRSKDGYAWLAATSQARDAIDSHDANSTEHAAKVITPRQAVPRNANAYVLFLVPDRTWIAGHADQLYELRSAFEDFGAAIGGRNLALWFESPSDPDSIDTLRSKYYCDLFHLQDVGLDYNSGPYVVTTSIRPDKWTSARDLVILKLSGISSFRTVALLNVLAQQLRTGRPRRTELIFKEIEERIATARDQHPHLLASIVLFIINGKLSVNTH